MHFLRVIDSLNEWAGKIISKLCLVMVALLVWEVLVRYVFNSPTIWAHEVTCMIFGAYFILAGGYILYHRAHVNMDIVCNRLTPRGRAILDLIGSPLFFIFCGLILYEGWLQFSASLQALEGTTSFWAPPLYPLKLAIPVGGFLILLQGIAKAIRDLIIVITPRRAI